MIRKKIFLLALILISTLFLSQKTFAENCLQSQPSSDGKLEACLMCAKVRGDVLTVKIILKNISDKKTTMLIYYKDFYYTDIKEKKKYFGLKDSEGSYIAGPKYDNNNGGRFWYDILGNEKKILWIKVPAPPDTTDVIDIIAPGILPFEEIKIER